MITVWPGRTICVWRDGKLIHEEALTETMARELVRKLLEGWDAPRVCSTRAETV